MRQSVRCLAVAVGLLAALAAAAPAQAAQARPASSPEKIKDIRRLLDLSGSGNLGAQVMTQMLGQFKTTMPKVPASFWDEVAKEVDPKELVDLVVPIYDQHLTHDDVKGAIAFYESPAGRAFVKALPAIASDSMAAGQAWGQKLGEKVVQRLKEKGYQR